MSSWMAALGEGGQRGLGRYEQLRESALDRKRQEMLDEQQRRLQALNEQNLNLSITGQQRGRFLEDFGPGSKLDAEAGTRAKQLGLGAFVTPDIDFGTPTAPTEPGGLYQFDPQERTDGQGYFQGTHQQIQADDDRKRAMRMAELQEQLLGIQTEGAQLGLDTQQDTQARRRSYLDNPNRGTMDTKQSMMEAIMNGLPEFAEAMGPILGSETDLSVATTQGNTARGVANINAGADTARLQLEQMLRREGMSADIVERLMSTYMNGLTRSGEPIRDEYGEITGYSPNPLSQMNIEDILRKAIMAAQGGWQRQSGSPMQWGAPMFGGGAPMFSGGATIER